MSSKDHLLLLVEHDIPEGRKLLQDSHTNLQQVATYCEGNYLQSANKQRALEETMNYTTQSLASVAYQINTLATNFLQLLDLQLGQMADMEANVNHLAQTVAVHKEKVARREIGVLTTNKAISQLPGVKKPGIVFPEQQERPVKYVRRSIDYSSLDDVGHGVKFQQQGVQARRANSIGSRPGVNSGQAPTSKPPTPPVAVATLGRQSSSPYRTPAPPVSPPHLPSHYAPGLGRNQQPQQQQQRRSGYASVGYGSGVVASPVPPPPLPPPTSVVPPMAVAHAPAVAAPSVISQLSRSTNRQSSYEPPPPPPLPESAYQCTGQIDSSLSPSLPPPPPDQMSDSMYLPPPPALPVFDNNYSGNLGGRSQYNFDEFDRRPESMQHQMSSHTECIIPDTYIEKVVAIYDYKKDKEDELSFCEGDVLFVTKKNDDGWWEGVMQGVIGLFPGNYVDQSEC